jgi:hypothetical protein
MGRFTLALVNLAVDQILADQELAKWRAEHTTSFHVSAALLEKLPIEIFVDGISIFIQPGWTPPPIHVAPVPTMAKPPTNWL